MTNTATSIITAAITAAVVGGVAAYLSTQATERADPKAPKENRSIIYVDHDGNNCTSFTFPFRGRVLQTGKVRWEIVESPEAKANNCLQAKKLELRPKSGASPLDPDKPSGSKRIQATAKTKTSNAPYEYEVWLVGGGRDMKLEDPELEIIELR